jgi:hypothetical protein
LFLKFQTENKKDMYILGFLFLFIGLSLLLYTILLLINPKPEKESFKESINLETQNQELNPKKEIDVINIPTNQNIEIQPAIEESTKPENIELTKPKAPTLHSKKIQTQNSSKPTQPSTSKQQWDNIKKIQESNLDLFLTGYLYYDHTRSTYILIEKRDRTSSEYLSNLIRLGNATIEWKVNTFIINYDENKIYLNYENLQEIRFSEECAIFIPKKNNEPYYYFFSNQTEELKQFLKELSQFV